jgi:hypothetical protein
MVADTGKPGTAETGVLQIAVARGSEKSLRDLLASRGLFLYRVPDIGDVPTYGIGTLATGTTTAPPSR